MIEKANCFRAGAEKHRLSSRDNEREHEDLVAQKTSALWTGIMGVAALIGMALSAVGVVLVWTTFRETRKANDIARESSENQIRPWLSVTLTQPPRMDVVDGRPQLRLHLNIANNGASPAINVSYVPDLCIGYEPHIPAHIAYSTQRKELLGYVGDIFHGRGASFTATVEHSDDPPGEETGFITVTVFYKTVFSEKLRTTAVFYRMCDPSRDDGLIDFSSPLSANQLVLVPWEEMAGVID